MTVQVLRSPSAVQDVVDPWVALADVAGARHSMQPYWCLPWWTHMREGDLHVAVVESGGGLAALAPLYVRRRLGIDTLRFLGSAVLGVSEILVAPGQEDAGDELWDYLLSRPRTILDLWQHRLGGPGFEALRRAERHPWQARLGPASPFVAVAGSWDEYWAGRRGKFRRELVRTERLAERERMPVRVEMAAQMDDVEQRLPDVTRVFDVATRVVPRLNFMTGAFRPFTLDMFRAAAERDRLALFVLYLGDTPAATAFTLRSGAVIGGGGLRFDHDLGRFSPGQLMLRHVFESVFGSDCTEFDFGPRDALYKRQWSTGVYDTVEISAFSSTAVHAVHVGKSALHRAQAELDKG
jgi:CelD/BcsL family acetyltransferase involved in cellulose biosynthesis